MASKKKAMITMMLHKSAEISRENEMQMAQSVRRLVTGGMTSGPMVAMAEGTAVGGGEMEEGEGEERGTRGPPKISPARRLEELYREQSVSTPEALLRVLEGLQSHVITLQQEAEEAEATRDDHERQLAARREELRALIFGTVGLSGVAPAPPRSQEPAPAASDVDGTEDGPSAAELRRSVEEATLRLESIFHTAETPLRDLEEIRQGIVLVIFWGLGSGVWGVASGVWRLMRPPWISPIASIPHGWGDRGWGGGGVGRGGARRAQDAHREAGRI